MKNKTKGEAKASPKGDTTSTKRSNAKIARWQAAAERDGFETWSQALTAWSNGEAHLIKQEKRHENSRRTQHEIKRF